MQTAASDFCEHENTKIFKRCRFRDAAKIMLLSSPGNYMAFNEVGKHMKQKLV